MFRKLKTRQKNWVNGKSGTVRIIYVRLYYFPAYFVGAHLYHPRPVFSRYGRNNCYWEGTHSRAHKNLLSPALATRKPIMPFRKAIFTYRKVWPPSTQGRSVCGYMEAAPFAVLGLFQIIKRRSMLLPLSPSCSEALSASLGKRIRGIESPWYIGQLPWEEESWGSKRPWYIWQFPWEDASCELNPVIHWTDFKTLGIKVK